MGKDRMVARLTEGGLALRLLFLAGVALARGVMSYFCPTKPGLTVLGSGLAGSSIQKKSRTSKLTSL
jgi:hypothetical protein